ncbi:MAG: hypothetical protein WCS73_11590 [Lentisphaeria bacterium]
MMIQQKKHFTLVEIMLALGVCAIGVCSIMVLFPIGVKACRDAAMKTYTANMADEMLHYTQYLITKDQASWDLYIAIESADEKYIAVAEGVYEDYCKDVLEKILLPEMIDHSKWDQEISDFGKDLYKYTGDLLPEPLPKIYQFISTKTIQSGGWDGTSAFESKIDFRCVGLLTKEQIEINGSKISLDKACKLKVIITWPAEIPYAQRERSVFSLEVFKPNF